jgi:hypothetical protein
MSSESASQWQVVVAGLLAMSAIVGCNKSAAERSPDRAKSAAAAVPADASAKLLGAWVAGEAGDPMPGQPNSAAPAAGEIERRMHESISEDSFQFEFHDRGRVTIVQGRGGGAENGTWDVVQQQGDRMVVRISAPGLTGNREPVEFAVWMPSGDRFTLRQLGRQLGDDAENPEFAFRRMTARR